MGVVAQGIGKVFGDPPLRVLTGIDAEIRDGEFVALTGRSGSGKSTLMYILSSLDEPSEGVIKIDGQDLRSIPDEELYRFRNQHMGFVFQFHYLIAELTTLDNVLMPTLKFNSRDAKTAYAESLLEKVGLKEKMNRLPRQLSGGEQQRVAIARALVMEPKYLFADEPTGSLDTLNGDLVMKIIKEINVHQKTTVVMVTHDPDFANLADRQIRLADGKLANS
ncbi:MAG: ATP-binding protein [Bdellovibrio sp.]|nr:MAG: ATP-binding protein [Bdellovibrio sp.]